MSAGEKYVCRLKKIKINLKPGLDTHFRAPIPIQWKAPGHAANPLQNNINTQHLDNTLESSKYSYPLV